METGKDKNESGSSESISSNTSDNQNSSSGTNLCIECKTAARAVVFVPCGHYIACVACGHGMGVCPMCQSQISACVRIYEESYCNKIQIIMNENFLYDEFIFLLFSNKTIVNL